MIMCVLLCYPVSIHMLQLQATGRPISSFFQLCAPTNIQPNKQRADLITEIPVAAPFLEMSRAANGYSSLDR